MDSLAVLVIRCRRYAGQRTRSKLGLLRSQFSFGAVRHFIYAVGSFSREQLEQGVNLAGLPTPMARQSLRVHLLTMQKGDVHETRWKQLQVGLHDDNLARLSAALEGLDAFEEELAAQQRAAAQPVACSYELIPE